MGAIAGGLSESSIGSAVSASSLGIIYGTGAGYRSGVRKWGGTVSFSTARRSDVPLGLEAPGDLPFPQPRARVPIVRQDIADAIESGVFGPVTGPYQVLQEREDNWELDVAARARTAAAAQVRTVGLAVPPPHQIACHC